MELFQRHMTTVAFKLAGGVDLSATSTSKFAKQNPIPQALTAKVVKAFFDALYALVDGLVILASSEPPTIAGKMVINEVGKPVGLNPLELLDLQNGVRFSLSILDILTNTLAKGYSNVGCDVKLCSLEECLDTWNAQPVAKRPWNTHQRR